MLNFYKLMFFSLLIISTLISISSQSWLGMWLGLEINLLAFIPMISNSANMHTTESSIKYFITQALASTILLFSIIMMSKFFQFNIYMQNFYSMIFNSALLTKMGAAPFHFWFPEVIEGLSWINSMILLTWQKISPMVLLMYNIQINYFTFIIITCMLISGIMGFNQISLRKILAYSSINHIGWMISSMMFMKTIWINYFITYTIISMNIILIFMKFNIFYLKQLYNSLNQNSLMKLFFIMNFLSLGGLPPFLGFFPKWTTIQLLISAKFLMLSILMIIMTLMTLYFYMRITFSTILLSMNEQIISIKMSMNTNFIIMFNFITITGLIYCTMIFNFI